MPKPEKNNPFFLSLSSQGSGLIRVGLEVNIRSCLRAILLTHVNERCLYPGLGSELRDLLFRPLTASTLADLQNQIRRAVEKAEPRVHLHSVEIKAEENDRSRLVVKLTYRILQTQKMDQVKIPVRP